MYPDSTTELVSRMTEYFYGLTEVDWGVNITTFTSATRALSRLPNLNIAKPLDGAVKSVLINKEVPSIAAFRVAYGHLCQRSKNKISTLALDSVCESQNALDDELWKVLEIAMFDNLKNIKRKVPKLLQALIRNRDFRGLDLIATKLKSYIVLNVYSVEIAEIRNQLTEMAKISNGAEKKIISKIKSAIKRDAKKLKKTPK
ncbi:MAG: hypothetical protein E6Q51_04880 [Methylophilus methylotrophus]|uniref:Uncharacterized protein n=1 Tax=Methylophilus methylotrophus TaxID=17 RepID=A0A5C7WJC4_METME|nr:MAG: hypothetical protein E6Q51_04880 [Methylophilus methylotrophus]